MLPLLLSLLHTTNDMFGSFLTPLLPRLQAGFGVSYGMVSLLVAIYSFSSSLLQPVAGLIADRYDRRVMAALGPICMALGSGLMGFYPNLFSFGLVLGLAGMGSALFHASGAALVGQYAPKGRKGFWLSFFGSGGQLGLSIGPLLSIGIANQAGLKGLAYLVPLVMIPAILVLRQAPPTNIHTKPSTFSDLARVFRGEIAKLWIISTLRNIAFMSFTTTIPYWFSQRGIPESSMALALSVYSFSAVAGSFLGGTFSDRFGGKPVMVITMMMAIPLYILLLILTPGHWYYLIPLALTGITMNAGIPVAVVMAQEHEPGQVATVSGLMLGFTWGFAGLFYALVGPLIEHFGVIPTLTALGMLLIPALLVTLSLQKPAVPQEASVAAD